MSALHLIQTLLPLGPDDEPPIDVKSTAKLENFQAYVESLKSNSQSLPHSLEQVRIEALLASSLEGSHVNSLTITDINKLINKFENYQSGIKVFRGRLEPIESILEDFNQELKDLSSSLTSLQEQSSSLTSDLNLQRGLSEKLNPIILDLMIPPDVVKSIMNDPLDIKWIENIRFINEKLQVIATTKSSEEGQLLYSYKGSKAATQLESGIQLLIAKAVERIRDFIITQIKLLRSSSTISSQKIQKKLLDVKEAYLFLKTHQSELASQLQLAYIYTMRWYYHVRFAKYLYALEKLHVRNIDGSYVIGHDTGEDKLGTLSGGFKSWLSSSNQPTSPKLHQMQQMQQSKVVTLTEYLQSIDKRLEILNKRTDSSTAIPSQIAETTPFNYWLEFLYNQWSIALVDNVVVEYLFMVEFFYQGVEKFEKVEALGTVTEGELNSNSHKSDWSGVMFENVYKLGYDFVTWLISHQTQSVGLRSNSRVIPSTSLSTNSTCDAYAILLIIRLIQATQSSLHNEFHIPILDDHLNSLLMTLWPQFTKIIDLNCDSMKKIIMRSFSSKSKDRHLAPVSVTQHFAQFLLGLLKLAFNPANDKNKEQIRGEPLFISIERLRNDFEGVLTKLSSHLFGNTSQSTQKEIFLFNNYFLIVSILKNENGSGLESNDFIDEQISHFEMLCKAYETK